VEEAQARFAREIGVPPGYHVSWLGMFENLERARRHFVTVIPVTIALIYALLFATFRSQRAALLLLASVPFAFIGGVVALWLRGMHLNVSAGVGFAALFGVSIMNGVLMVRSINTLRMQGTEIETAIVQGSLHCLRPILMASLVAILGLLPASLSMGLGSDVQRPLATVIVWGLFSAMTLTLFVVPVLYRVFQPSLPEAVASPERAEGLFMEPLPEVSPADVVALLEDVHARTGADEIFRIADRMNLEFGRVVMVVKAAELLGLVETPGQSVALTAAGGRFVDGNAAQRIRRWRDQLLKLGLFRIIYETAQQHAGSIDRDFVLETIVTRMPHENYAQVFNTFVRWARFGRLFDYDAEAQRIIVVREQADV